MNLAKHFLRRAPVAFALFAGFILIPAGRAQSSPQIADSRYLLIFDTSPEMKKRLPAVRTEVNELLASSLGGRLRAGDSLGVWTFDQDLHTGQFPLQHWRPENAVTMASTINKFVGKQHFANPTRFDALQPQLNQVIQNSPRLTVLIFCDGEDQIKWTPYAAGINQFFQQRLAEQKKTREPFVLVFITQFGQYAGCTMNFPPGMVSIPDFPPPSALPVPVKTPSPAPVVAPPPTQPLIIIGRTVETNWPPAPAPMLATNPAPVTPANVVPAATNNPVESKNPIAPPLPNPVPMVPTNVVSVPPTQPVAPKNPTAPSLPTNPAPAIQTNFAPETPTNRVSLPASNPIAPANPVVPPEKSGPGHRGALLIGGVLLIAAVLLAALAFIRARRANRGSLISRSMRKD